MESALIISDSEKNAALLAGLLKSIPCYEIVTLPTCGEARRLLLERDFDLYLINAPLPDETGEKLSYDIVLRGNGQVILLVKAEYYDETSVRAEEMGVITVSKPVNRNMLWSALKITKAAYAKIQKLQNENTKLVKKIEDIKLIDRAKCLLVSKLSVSEGEAHRRIEKQAMDKRISRREIAEDIIKTYGDE